MTIVSAELGVNFAFDDDGFSDPWPALEVVDVLATGIGSDGIGFPK
ncbi:hypothetical protein [Rhodopseudomonas palustris]|nr:hypothetical protein [Rhodopseudomonas palustris]